MRIVARHLVHALCLVAVLASLSLTAVSARAQSTEWYAIEMIIFANTNDDGRNTETWRTDTGLPDTSRAAPISAGGRVAAISSNAYRLSGVWQALRNSPKYRPLRHLAWTQRGSAKRSAPEVLIGDDLNSAVFGKVRMSRARFLHLDLDLLLRDVGDNYRFINHRRMRSNELHYIDHPMFGVLVIATPMKS